MNFVIWLTGLSGSGKTTIAEWTKNSLPSFINKSIENIIILDGDEIRAGLNKDLGFTFEERTENVRRIAEIANLLKNKGFIVIVSCMSPKLSDRLLAETIIGKEFFMEVFCNSSFETCKMRDVKGLYKKALNGDIRNFIGFQNMQYEPPLFKVSLPTEDFGIGYCTEILVDNIRRKFKF